MRIEKCRAMPIDRRVFVSELDVTGSQIRMVGVLMEAKHQVSGRFDPVDTVVFVVNAGWIPEANLQSCGLRVVGVTQKRGRIDIRDDVSRSASRRAIAYVLTPWLVRQSVVNVAEEGPLCIAVATSEKDHIVREED
nr:hypothetical protein [Halomicroarcula sp. SYNS111]